MRVSTDDFARFAASPPPRRIPPAIRAARLPAAPLVVALAVALLLFAATAPIVSAVFPDRLVDDLRLALATPAHAAGTVFAVDDTGRSIVVHDGGRDVDRPIRRVRFRFAPDGAGEHEGASHTSGTAPAVGSSVDVEYLPGRPQVARIVGGTLSSTPLVGALVLLLPAIGLAWLWRVVRRRRSVRALLVGGRFELARIASLRERRPFLGHGRLEATLLLPDARSAGVDFDAQGVEAATLRAAEAASRPVAVLRDPQRPEHLLLVETFVEGPPESDAEDDEDVEVTGGAR